MNFRILVFFISLSFSILLSGLSYYYVRNWQHFFFILFISFILSFIILNNVLHRHIYIRISNIYKLIRSLKLGKDMKETLAEHASEDPIKYTEDEVRDWATQRSKEINQLKEQERYRREFLANISHEFKTPLFAIQGYIDTLQDGVIHEDPEMAQNFLTKASRNIDRLTYLIRDLDEIAKLETDKASLNIEKFDIVQLISETIEHLEDKASRQDMTILYDHKTNAPIYVKADRQKVQQVLINLIDNAIKYGRTGGKTKVKTFMLLDQLLVEVTDDGMGIEEKNLSRVFERFYRTDKSRSRDIGGSGLGLSIVKHIIEAHQQTVNVRSTEGLGTTFGFTLEKAKN